MCKGGSPQLREELQRVTVEQAEKSARVQELERARDKLEGYLDWETRRVDMLLIQSTASSKQALLKEIKVLACLWLDTASLFTQCNCFQSN